MVIASDREEKMPATQQWSTWESVRTQLAACTMILSALGGNVDSLFSVKVFLNDDENKIQIFSCRF